MTKKAKPKAGKREPLTAVRWANVYRLTNGTEYLIGYHQSRNTARMSAGKDCIRTVRVRITEIVK